MSLKISSKVDAEHRVDKNAPILNETLIVAIMIICFVGGLLMSMIGISGCAGLLRDFSLITSGMILAGGLILLLVGTILAIRKACFKKDEASRPIMTESQNTASTIETASVIKKPSEAVSEQKESEVKETKPEEKKGTSDKQDLLDGFEVQHELIHADTRDYELYNQLSKLVEDSSESKVRDIPWEEIITIINRRPDMFEYFFPKDVSRHIHTKTILRLLKPPVLKSLLKFFTGVHFRMLSDLQFKSEHFPGDVVAEIFRKSPNKLEDFFPTFLRDTRTTLRLFRPNVRKQLEPILSPALLEMLK